MDNNSYFESISKYKIQIENLKEKENLLLSEYNELVKEKTALKDEFNNIEIKTEESATRLKNTQIFSEIINEKKLIEGCEEVIGSFLKEINPSNTKIANDYCISVNYNNIQFIRYINDNKYTFENLKKDIKKEIKELDNDEFFFADEKDNIFLEELNVINILFPLKKIKINNYIPVVHIVQIKEKRKLKQINPIKKIKENTKTVSYIKEIIKKFFAKKSFQLYFTISFILFIIFYINFSFNFSKSNDNIIYKTTYEQILNNLLNNMTLEREQADWSINAVNNGYCWLNYFLNQSFDKNNNLNDLLGPFRILFKEGIKDDKCKFSRINTKNGNITVNCSNKFDVSKKHFGESIENGNNKYNIQKYSTKFQGFLNLYNTYGRYIDVSIDEINVSLSECGENKPEYIQNIKDENIAMILISNMYNRHMDSMAVTVIFFENMVMKFNVILKTEIINLSNNFNKYAILSLIFSLICIILMILDLIKKRKIVKEININKRKIDFPLRLPNFFEILFFINMIILYVILIYRFKFYLKDIEINRTIFNDFSIMLKKKYYITFFNCINIFISFIILIYRLGYFFTENRIIFKTILDYLGQIYYFCLLYIIFIFLTFLFVLYYMNGDFVNNIYCNTVFIISKIIQSCFRSSIGDDDYTKFNIFGNKSILLNDYSFVQNNFSDIKNKTGILSYIIYNFLYYLIIFFGLKLAIFTYCYTTYKENYIKNQKIEKLKSHKDISNEKNKKIEKKAKENINTFQTNRVNEDGKIGELEDNSQDIINLIKTTKNMQNYD